MVAVPWAEIQANREASSPSIIIYVLHVLNVFEVGDVWSLLVEVDIVVFVTIRVNIFDFREVFVIILLVFENVTINWKR